MIHIFKHRKGQTYQQIQLAKDNNISFYLF